MVLMRCFFFFTSVNVYLYVVSTSRRIFLLIIFVVFLEYGDFKFCLFLGNESNLIFLFMLYMVMVLYVICVIFFKLFCVSVEIFSSMICFAARFSSVMYIILISCCVVVRRFLFGRYCVKFRVVELCGMMDILSKGLVCFKNYFTTACSVS